MKKAKKFGGAQENAGRNPVHPEGETRKITVTVPVAIVEKADEKGQSFGLNRSQSVTTALRDWLDS